MNKKLVLYVCIPLLWLCGCKEDPDPCEGQKPVTADFRIEENVNNQLFETDTVLTSNPVHFTASEDYDSYEWKVGFDDRTFDKKTFSLLFLEPYGKIEVTLIAKRKPNLACFPKDDGIDTLKKSFVVVPRANSAMAGEYEGYVVGKENDKFTVTITYHNTYGYFLKNIQKGCMGDQREWADTYNLGVMTAGGYNSLVITQTSLGSGGCKAPNGSAKLKNHSQIEIEYDYWNDAVTARIKEKFIGIRK